MFKDPSSPVKASNLNTLNPDLLTLYRRPSPIKIWPTYAVPPTTTLNPRSTYDLWRAGSSPTIFQPVEKLIPLITTSQNGPDQLPLYFRPTYALPDQGPLIADLSIFSRAGESGGWSGLWCERALSLINPAVSTIYPWCIHAQIPFFLWPTPALPVDQSPLCTTKPRSILHTFQYSTNPDPHTRLPSRCQIKNSCKFSAARHYYFTIDLFYNKVSGYEAYLKNSQKIDVLCKRSPECFFKK